MSTLFDYSYENTMFYYLLVKNTFLAAATEEILAYLWSKVHSVKENGN